MLLKKKKKLCLEFFLFKKMGPKKTVVHKRPRGSSSSNFDPMRFISADADARFHDSVTQRLGLQEQGFDIDIESP